MVLYLASLSILVCLAGLQYPWLKYDVFVKVNDLTLSWATAQYCATATCTNDHCIHVFSYTTNICVANNTIILKRKCLFTCHICGVALGRAFLVMRKCMIYRNI